MRVPDEGKSTADQLKACSVKAATCCLNVNLGLIRIVVDNTKVYHENLNLYRNLSDREEARFVCFRKSFIY
jgi:hypothetical protein